MEKVSVHFVVLLANAKGCKLVGKRFIISMEIDKSIE